ncbi:GNAT family N-acetyltransferase [Longispora albida]|uniref:GNAT family N-acetyltransferase n=1 Tax=Longispora albida TaxID=203523 RepID=UPI00035E614F|nr:GNAT family N-acetyltransferase [Longispora albida]
MTLWRIRTEVDDRPGRLAALSRALADVGGNILTLAVQVDASGVVDEFIVETPPRVQAGHLGTALHIAGGRGVAITAATRRDLVDEPTRALLLAARLGADQPQDLPALLAELLRADSATWLPETRNDHDHHTGTDLVVPVAPGRHIVLTRSLPFTLTEAARAEAFVRLLRAPGIEASPHRESVTLADGTRLPVRLVLPTDEAEVQALHRRCTAETRRARYFVARRQLTGHMWRAFCDPAWGLTFVVRTGTAPEAPAQAVALAHLAYTPEPGVAELAILVEDSWQNRGLGSSLVTMLVAEARDRGLVELRASLLADNVAMRRLLASQGAAFSYGGAVVDARLPLSQSYAERDGLLRSRRDHADAP